VSKKKSKLANFRALYRRVTAEAPFAGPAWYGKLIGTLQSLDTFPERGQNVRDLSRSEISGSKNPVGAQTKRL